MPRSRGVRPRGASAPSVAPVGPRRALGARLGMPAPLFVAWCTVLVMLVIVSVRASRQLAGIGPRTSAAAAAAPSPSAQAPTPTEREIARICRAVRTDRPVPLSWGGHLGQVALSQHLTFDWRCHVASVSVADGIACGGRAGGPPLYRIVPLRWPPHATRPGDTLVFDGLRRALADGDGAAIGVEAGCRVRVAVDDLSLLRARSTTRTRPGINGATEGAEAPVLVGQALSPTPGRRGAPAAR